MSYGNFEKRKLSKLQYVKIQRLKITKLFWTTFKRRVTRNGGWEVNSVNHLFCFYPRMLHWFPLLRESSRLANQRSCSFLISYGGSYLNRRARKRNKSRIICDVGSKIWTKKANGKFEFGERRITCRQPRNVNEIIFDCASIFCSYRLTCPTIYDLKSE